MRRSWTEAEKRISATSSARRRAASRPSPPIPRRPAASAARASTAPSAASKALVPCWSGSVARSPSIVVGELFQPWARSSADQTTRTTPIAPATPIRSRRPEAQSAEPSTATGTSAPKAASAPIHSSAEPGKRRKTKLPITAPVAAPAITAIRSCESAAGRSAVRRETGASSV